MPANQAIPRMRDSSGVLPVVGAVRTGAERRATEAAERTPATASPVQPAAPVAPPPWPEVFPAHYRALVADLQKRGEDPNRWEIQDGRDLGVTDAGHTIAFRLHKIDTSVSIQIELTLFKGKLALVRVR